MLATIILFFLVLDAMWITHSIITAPIVNDEEYMSYFGENSIDQ
jgi:hypothetical protein